MRIGIVKKQTFCLPGVGLWRSLLLFPSHYSSLLYQVCSQMTTEWGSGREARMRSKAGFLAELLHDSQEQDELHLWPGKSISKIQR